MLGLGFNLTQQLPKIDGIFNWKLMNYQSVNHLLMKLLSENNIYFEIFNCTGCFYFQRC